MLKDFTIHDIIPKRAETKLVFLLESPYKAEIENGYPVAGLSGSEICRVLNKIDSNIPSNIPFGKYMSESKDPRFGIVNCSNLPMDIKTYPQELLNNELIHSLDRIRKNPKTAPEKRQNKSDGKTHSELLENLSSRLNDLISKNSSFYIITCGNLAKYFLEATGIKSINSFHIAHPSFNQWRQAKNQPAVNELKQIIGSAIT